MLERYEVDMVKTLSGMENAARGLRQLLEPGFHADPELAETLKPILLRTCGRFLLNEKKGKRAVDPVAHFHFMNGASLHRINWLADKSSRALSRSFGIMANYLYKPSDIEKNHELYASEGQPAVSKEMRGALKK
jgi:malonyl-CoA decarboxylase